MTKGLNVSDFNLDSEVYKLIVEQLDGAVVTDKDGRYVYVTKSWEKYFGITIGEIKGKYEIKINLIYLNSLAAQNVLHFWNDQL